jgi:hypothetical protein
MAREEREYRVTSKSGSRLGLVHATTCRQALRQAKRLWPRLVRSVVATCPRHDGEDVLSIWSWRSARSTNSPIGE